MDNFNQDCDQTFNELVKIPLLSILTHVLKSQTVSYKQHSYQNSKDNSKDNSKYLLTRFLQELDGYHQRQVHCLQDLKQRDSKKIHGDLFEVFAKLYLQIVLKIPHVWLLRDIPDVHLQQLKLKRHDVGIDIIGMDNNKNYYACQAKYKSQKSGNRRKISVTWKEISTFFALSARTGPYNNLIVVTTANYVRHMAPKTSQDVSICIGTLGHISRDCWQQMRDTLANEIATVQYPQTVVKNSSKNSNSVGNSFSNTPLYNSQDCLSNDFGKRVYFNVYDDYKKTWCLSDKDLQSISNIKSSSVVQKSFSAMKPQMNQEKITQCTEIREGRLRHFVTQ